MHDLRNVETLDDLHERSTFDIVLDALPVFGLIRTARAVYADGKRVGEYKKSHPGFELHDLGSYYRNLALVHGIELVLLYKIAEQIL